MSTTPLGLQNLSAPADELPRDGEVIPARRRWLSLGLVLVVSFSHPIAGSIYYLLGGMPGTDPLQQRYRLFAALLTEATSLALLWYVLSGQSRTWKQIGWDLSWKDLLPAVGLIVTSTIAIYAVLFPFQLSYRAFTGHYLAARSLHGVLSFGVSALSIAFVCLNPLYEELIVRAYTMSEIMSLGGSRTLAVLISVVVQMSYHTYQGLLRGIGLAVTFLVFSIYFSKTRRIGPVVLAHFCVDAYALIRGAF